MISHGFASCISHAALISVIMRPITLGTVAEVLCQFAIPQLASKWGRLCLGTSAILSGVWNLDIQWTPFPPSIYWWLAEVITRLNWIIDCSFREQMPVGRTKNMVGGIFLLFCLTRRHQRAFLSFFLIFQILFQLIISLFRIFFLLLPN